jgi:alkanesulfonate monooxygenase SsuD/methylene tetrahydromethanopterin reductase-like flavin-dependent oxidoreductase (luciferase family)
VDVLSDGRLTLGIGVGYMRGEYAALGVEFEARGALTDEALETMKMAWSGESVVRQGGTFNAVGNLPKPLPVQKPHPPIWVGGNSDRAIRRAAEHCNGWAPIFATGALATTTRTDEIGNLEQLKAKLDVLHDHRARVGRTGPFDICAMPPVGFKSCDASEVQQFVDMAGKLADLGANWLVGGLPHPSRAAYLENVQWLGEEVLPKVKALGKNA